MKKAFPIIMLFLICSCSGGGVKMESSVSSIKPDFFLYEGDGNRDLLEVVRSAWIIKSIRGQQGQDIMLAKINPPVSKGVLHEEAEQDVLGFALRSSSILDGLKEHGISSVIVYSIQKTAEGEYKSLDSEAMATIYSEKPEKRPDVPMPTNKNSV